MPTIKDVARECSVSANTVSSVLNNRVGEVSEQTRERILEAIKRLGYRPSAAARRMLGKRAHTIGIADRYSDIPDLSDPYKSLILEPLMHAARSRRWDVLYYSGHAEPGAFPAFLDGRCDGLICFTGRIDLSEVAAIVSSELPVIFIGDAEGTDAANRAAVIDVDNRLGGYLATAHLIGLGHRRIAMLQGVGIAGNLGRLAGYRQAIRELGAESDERLVVHAGAWEQLGYDHTRALLAFAPGVRPTALFCFNDAIAIGAVRGAKDSGFAVPTDLSVVGFDDFHESSLVDPPLTTVAQPLPWIGKRAAESIIDIIEGRLPRNHKETVTPHLIVRASTAPPRSRGAQS